jgi:hypothetical protein
MTRPRTLRRLLLATLPVILAVSLGGVAYAYWSGPGGGTGSATTGTTAAVTLRPGTPAGKLHPGGTSDVGLTMSNPNAFSVRIDSLALDTGQGTLGFAVDTVHSLAGCTAAGATLSYPTQATGWTVPAKVGAVDGTLSVTLTGALAMSLDAASLCQGATFTVYVKAGT